MLLLAYRFAEYQQWVDRLCGRDLAMKGLNRLKSTAGYPVNWISILKEEDKQIFLQLVRRITKKTSEPTILKLHLEKILPAMVATAGNPLEIQGVPSDWPQKDRFSFLAIHPILYIYNASDFGSSKQKALKACTLQELESWLEQEKRNRIFWVDTFAYSLISIAFIFLRLQIKD